MGFFKNHSRARAIAHCGDEFPRAGGGERPRIDSSESTELIATFTWPKVRFLFPPLQAGRDVGEDSFARRRRPLAIEGIACQGAGGSEH
eukprot:COSAG02_NODE_3450_length_6721_cov_10.974487_3_plen_89_part_00